MVQDARFPKRRRPSGSPTAIDIAASNATVTQFLGARNNRWMSGYQAIDSITPVSTNIARPTQTEQTGQIPGRINATTALESLARVSEANERESRSETTVLSLGALGLARMHSPHVRGQDAASFAPPPVRESANFTIRKRSSLASTASTTATARPNIVTSAGKRTVLDAPARAAAQPALPSPAPSDDLVQSPQDMLTMGEPLTDMSPSTAAIPNPRNTTASSSRSNSTIPHVGPSGQRTNPPTDHQQTLQQPQARHTVPSAYILGSSSQPINLTQGGSNAHNPDGAPLQQSRSTSGMQISAPNEQVDPLSPAGMIANVNAAVIYRSRLKGMKDFDNARLSLLRDAVLMGDFTYIVLNQLSCIRVSNRAFLPAILQDVPDSSFAALDDILVSNSDLHPQLLHWFADFPAPITAIYGSTTAKVRYEYEVLNIKLMLQLMTMGWKEVCRQSQARCAPPLVQDLVTGLNITSRVLQDTTFRAIARLYWKDQQPSHAFKLLENAHLQDQRCYAGGIRLDPNQTRGRYVELAAIFEQRYGIAQQPAMTNAGRRLPQSSSVQSMTPQPRAPQSVHLGSSHAGSPIGMEAVAQIRAELEQYAHLQRMQAQQATPTPNQAMSQAQHTSRTPSNATTAPPFPTIATGRQTGPRSLFPAVGDLHPAQPTHPDTTRTALHQAHLRSPTLGATELAEGEQKLYRHVVGFALPPTTLSKHLPTQAFSFRISAETYDKLAQASHIDDGERCTRTLSDSSLLCRLRCVATTSQDVLRHESAWVVADAVWPDHTYFSLNGHMLEPRRKLHHPRCLPIDLTQHVKPGANTLQVFVNRTSTDPTPYNHSLAVEMLGVMAHNVIISRCAAERTIPADESLAAIKRSLSRAAATNEDDVAVVSSSLAIKLFDPFSGSRICDTPVRGATCLHRDCFDLATFLGTRKRLEPGWPSQPDHWRCPLCMGDARPQQLVLDAFLLLVRRDLEARRLLDTRAIVVDAEGGWTPKSEELSGVRSQSLERQVEARDSARPSVGPAEKRKERVVIELD